MLKPKVSKNKFSKTPNSSFGLGKYVGSTLPTPTMKVIDAFDVTSSSGKKTEQKAPRSLA